MCLSGHEQQGPPERREFENWAIERNAAVQHVIAPPLGACRAPAPTSRCLRLRSPANSVRCNWHTCCLIEVRRFS